MLSLLRLITHKPASRAMLVTPAGPSHATPLTPADAVSSVIAAVAGDAVASIGNVLPIPAPTAVSVLDAVFPLPLTVSPVHPTGVGLAASPGLSATVVHTTPPVVATSPEKQSISPASSSGSSDSSASSNLSAPSSDDILSASSSSASSGLSSSDTSNVSTASADAMSGAKPYAAAESADRQRAHVAETAYQSLFVTIKALSEHIALVQLSNAVSDVVKKGLEETLDKAKRGWKKIKTERKKRRKKKRALKERTMKQEGEHRRAIAATMAAPAVVGGGGGQLGGGGAGVSGSNILQVLSAGNEDGGGRKRRQVPDSSAADTTMNEAEDNDDDEEDEEEEGDGQDVPLPLAFASIPPRLAVASLTSPVAAPLNVITPASSASNATSSSLLPSTAATGPSYQAMDGVSDAQAPVVMSCSKFPIAVLNVPVQRQYTMTRKDSKRMKRADKEALVDVTVRIMGTPDRQHIYFVAKDVCQLICLRKGSVAKAIHDFSGVEKARMPVLCQRSSGSGCTQVLTVLTMAGVQRLMTSSRQPIARSVLQWLSERVGEIQAGQMPSTAFDPNATLQPADSASHPPTTSANHQQPPPTNDTTALLFPPQSSQQLPTAPSAVSLYHQYGLSDMSLDLPVSPQISFAGTRPSLQSFSQFPLSTPPNAHSLTAVTQFANHAFLNPTSMSLPSFSPVSSFGSSTSSFSLPGAQAPQPPNSLHSQGQLLPVGYPSLLSQLLSSSASTSPAFSSPHQPQANNAGHSLFLSGAGGVNLFPGLAHAAPGSRQSTPGAVHTPPTPQSQLNQLLAVHQQQQQQQQQQRSQALQHRLTDQHAVTQLGSPGMSLSHPTPRSLLTSSPHRPPASSHTFLPATSAASSPYTNNAPSNSHRGQLS